VGCVQYDSQPLRVSHLLIGRSALVLPYVRNTKTLQPAILWRYFKHCPQVAACSDETALSTGEMEPARATWRIPFS
jgi:hypothetical protein